MWKCCCQVFDFLVLGAVIDGKVLCVHGGLSPEIRTLDQIRVIARAQEIPHEGAFCDLVWSDPEEVGTWAVSPRGAGWLFGNKVATEFNYVNGFQLIARAHQLVQEGYKVLAKYPRRLELCAHRLLFSGILKTNRLLRCGALRITATGVVMSHRL